MCIRDSDKGAFFDIFLQNSIASEIISVFFETKFAMPMLIASSELNLSPVRNIFFVFDIPTQFIKFFRP